MRRKLRRDPGKPKPCFNNEQGRWHWTPEARLRPPCLSARSGPQPRPTRNSGALTIRVEQDLRTLRRKLRHGMEPAGSPPAPTSLGQT
jgi:hypothetical protein